MNTYQLKKQLKKQGFIYNRSNRTWENLWMSVFIEDEFHMYVDGAFESSALESSSYLGHNLFGYRFSYYRMSIEDFDKFVNCD